MNLFRHKNGQYYIRYSRSERPPNGTNISLKKVVGYPVKDEKKAREILRILTEEWHKSKLAELDRTKRITLTEFIDEYTTGERSDLAGPTLRMDNLSLRLLADTCGPSRAIRAIDAADLIKFKSVCLGRGLSPNTVKTYLRHIKAALNCAIERGYRSGLPKFPKIKTAKPIPRVIDPDAITAILTWAKENDIETWRYASFSLWTGCRLSEIRNLRWQDVIIDRNATDGICGKAVVTGKGDKQRTIYLTAAAIDAMGEAKHIGRVFHPWTATTISKKFKFAARSAGHPEAHYHCLRHTAATMMITAGIPLEVVQKILGHADIRTTQIYAKVMDNFIRSEMGKLAGAAIKLQ